MAKYTITYDEKVKGWTSFHSFIPDFMVRMNNKFFTIKDGELYLHNDENDNVPRNNFYGTSYPTKLNFVFNQSPSDVKSFKSVNIEGNIAWDVELHTNLTNGEIHEVEFINKEDEWYSHIRRNENSSDTSSISVQGLGRVLNISTNEIFLNVNLNPSLSVGDKIFKLNEIDSTMSFIGTCVNVGVNSITLDMISEPVLNDDFILLSKDNRIESSMIRGYYMVVKMTSSSTDRVELFAVNTELFKSFE